MTDNELREIVETEGLAGMLASVFTKERIYIGHVARINISTLMLTDPKVVEKGDTGPREITGTPSIAETAHKEDSQGAAHKYVAIAIEHIEAIGF